MKNNKKRLIILILILLLASLFPVSAYADIPNTLKTYTVYNEFNSTVNAFQRLGLMMSDSSYKGLFFSVVALGILIGGLLTIGKGIFSGKATAMAWIYLFGMIIGGVMIYSAFVKNTTEITVYDESLNKQIAVGGIPDGVAFIAGLANKIETGLVDIIWTSGDPRSYRENAGGLGFSIFTKAYEGGVDLSGTGNGGIYNNISLRRYIKDCLYFELSRPGSTLSINNIQINSDFIPILEQAVNPAIYTVWYDEANKAGISMTCTEAWNKLKAYLNSLTDTSIPVKQHWEERCKQVLSDISSSTGPTIAQACTDKAVALQADILGIAVSSSATVRQLLVASELWNVMQETDPDLQMSTLSSQSAGAHLIGMGVQANDWIPIIRGVLFTVILGSLPFLFLLVPTPLFPRIMSLIFGMFAFMVAWGVCDALAHSFAMDRAYDMFSIIQKGKLGFISMMLMKNTSCKALAVFGAARWSSMMVAGLLSSALTKTGGAMLAHTLSGIQSPLISAGAGAGAASAIPTDWASKVSSVRHVAPTAVYSNQFKYDEVAEADTVKELSGIKTGLGEVKDIGHGSVHTASDKLSHAKVLGERDTISKTRQMERAANKYYGGNFDASRDAANASVFQPVGQGAEMQRAGRDPGDVYGLAGERHAEETIGQTDRYIKGGPELTRQTAEFEAANEQARFLSHSLRDNTLNGLNPSDNPEFVRKANSLFQTEGGRAAWQKNMARMELTPGNDTEAANVARALHLHPEDVKGRTIVASASFDPNTGTFALARADLRSGIVGDDTNLLKRTEAGPEGVTKAYRDINGKEDVLRETERGSRSRDYHTKTGEYDLTAEQARRITGQKGAHAGHYVMHMDPDTNEIVGIKGEGGFRGSTGNVIMRHNAEDGTDQIQVINPEDGKAVWTSAKLGRETRDIDKDTYDHRNVRRSGFEDTRGIKLSGADGLVQSDDATSVNRARDFDLIQANKLGASGKTGQRNAELLAMSGGKYVSNVLQEQGADIGTFKTFASAHLGWGKTGVGTSADQTWQNQKSVNYIASGIYQDMMKAKKTAIAKGLNETETGHYMQGVYNSDIRRLTAKGFAAKPIRKTTEEAVNKVNSEAVGSAVNHLAPDTASMENPGSRKSAEIITQDVRQSQKETTTSETQPSEPASSPDSQPVISNQKKTASKQSNASQLADQVVSGDKGQANGQVNTTGRKGTPQGPTLAMTR